MTVVTRVTLVALGLLMPFQAADGQSRGPDPFPTVAESFGVNVHTLAPTDEELNLLRRAGLHTIRTDCNWEQTERRPGK